MSSDALRHPLARLAAASANDGSSAPLPLADATDDRLVGLAARGDRDAFQVLAGRYRPRVAQFIRWFLDDRLAADDVVQDVFVEALQSLPSFRGDSSFRTWLYALVRNVCRNHARRIRLSQMDDEVAHGIPDTSLDPLGALERDELVTAVRTIVEGLPRDHRLVLMLRDWEELSYAEIGVVLGIPVGTVRSRLHHARARVATSLVRQGFGKP